LFSIAFTGCSSDDIVPDLEQGSSSEVGSSLVTDGGAQPIPHLTVEPVHAEQAQAEPGVSVDLAIQFDGVGRVHRGYFRDPETIEHVGLTLVGLIAPPANVHIKASGARGDITAVVTVGALSSPVMMEDGRVDLSVLTPVTVSMVGYRDQISGKFDFRVQSFGVSVSVVSDSSWCTFTATGQHPPTGEQLSECLDVDGEEVCGVVSGRFLHLSPADVERVSECMR
jgi:hypothetical protein